jgi:hypothetical protein
MSRRTIRDCWSRPLIAALPTAIGLALIGGACGGGGGAVDALKPDSSVGTVPNDAARSTAILITEDQIASLAARQQELLSDPGWNQPYLGAREKTPMKPPTPGG